MQVPWATPRGRVTVLLERLALDVLWARSSVAQACALLHSGWDAAHEIMRAGGQTSKPRPT